MTDFLLELRSEEIPARMQASARAELEKLFRREMASAGIDVTDVTTYATPRRLALIARELPDATAAVSEEAKGPPEGAPDAALDGFCRKNGVKKHQLQLRDVKGRQTWFAVIDKPGRATKALLADAIAAILRDFAWPKSMRWGAASLSTESARWVRPLSGIVAIFGEELVECEAAGIASGYATLGHRFHHSGPSTIGGAHDYVEKLHACHVIVDHEERAALIREGAAKAAADAGLTLVADEGLVVENAGLTEWPVPLLGRFDEAFLDVPPEVIQLTARVNQKYFVCTRSPAEAGASGGGAQPNEVPAYAGNQVLANAFICTANIAAEDGGAAIVEGNRKVLAARLSDARFFWEQDRKVSLADHAKKLERITFHEKLGTVADKVERVAKLARWLVEEGIVKSSPIPRAGGDLPRPGASPTEVPAFAGTQEDLADTQLADWAEQAARLCKADLVTEMVGEFPELQGVMGGYYARAEGLPREVADAIRDHYKPVGQGDEVPTAPVTVAVSLADKLDTLVGFYANRMKPTGSRDPFALRRAVLGAIAVILTNRVRATVSRLISLTFDIYHEQWSASFSVYEDFFEGSLKSRAFQSDGRHVDTFFVSQHPDSPAVLAIFGGERAEKHAERVLHSGIEVEEELLDFFAERLKVQQREAGVRHDLIDAVFALGGEDDLVRLLARVKALQSFVGTEDGTNLLAGYKRAANILKKEDWRGIEGEIAHTGEEDPLALVDDPDMAAVIAAKMAERHQKKLSYPPEPAEAALIAALDAAEPTASAAIEAEDFAAAMTALASLRAPIDQFFDDVTVNDPNSNKRAARLDLLLRFRDAVHRVADFSRIEG